jgi:hypothetical protein
MPRSVFPPSCRAYHEHTFSRALYPQVYLRG